MTTDQAVSKLEALKARFAERLPERLKQLEQLVGQAQQDATVRAEAKAVAHRLAGTAGSYGFVEVGEAAAALERELDRVLETGDEGNWSTVEGALARVLKATP